MVEERKTHNICLGSGCHEMCVITTIVQDGKVVHTERTYAPGSGIPITGICQKGIEYAKSKVHPHRLPDIPTGGTSGPVCGRCLDSAR